MRTSLTALALSAVLSFAAWTPSAFAQPVYAIDGPTIVAINPTTGAQTLVASGVTGFIGISAFDVAGGRLFFTGLNGLATVLWSVNVTSGAVTQVPLSSAYGWIEWDPVTARLYAGDGTTIVSINPATGAQTTVASGITGFIGISAIDVAGRRLFFTGLNGLATVLWSVNLTSGAVTQVPLSSAYGWIEWDPVTGRLYAIDGSTIVAINPTTGTQTLVTSGINGFIGISTFDVAGRRLLFTGPSSLSTVLWSVNVTTGVATQIPLASSYGWIELGVAPPPPPPAVPLLDPAGLALLIVIMVGLAVLRLRMS